MDTMYAYIFYCEKLGVIDHIKDERFEFDEKSVVKHHGKYYKIIDKKQILSLDHNVLTVVIFLEETDGLDLPEDILYRQYI